jgi:hypothetical protein
MVSVVIYPPSMIVPERAAFSKLARTSRDSKSTTRRLGFAAAAVIVFVVMACAPEPTTPADTSLAGVWQSTDSLFGLSRIKMTMIQESRGIVSGTWAARAEGGVAGCSVGVPCNASGNLIGLNTVSKADIQLLGAANFEGVLEAPTRLRGALLVGNSYDTITFNRTSN